jgi:antirestriction protein ArdC
MPLMRQALSPAHLRHNGEAYSGINTLILWCYAMERAYSAPIWMTFQQARTLGAHVRKGEASAPVVYAGAMSHSETDQATGEETESTRRFLKSYRVFNVDQIEGLPAHYYAKAEPRGAAPRAHR